MCAVLYLCVLYCIYVCCTVSMCAVLYLCVLYCIYVCCTVCMCAVLYVRTYVCCTVRNISSVANCAVNIPYVQFQSAVEVESRTAPP